MLSVCGDPVSDILRDCKCNLIDAVECELGEGLEISHDEITLHNLAHYYGHFL